MKAFLSAHAFHGGVQRIQGRTHVLGELAAKLGRAHAPPGAFEQAHAKCIFQRMNLVADRTVG